MKQKIIVELDARWERWINSPVYLIVSLLSGVSITFAPLYLYWYGHRFGEEPPWKTLACFAVIYLVPLFYIRLGSAIAKSIQAQSGHEKSDRFPAMMNRLGRLFRRDR